MQLKQQEQQSQSDMQRIKSKSQDSILSINEDENIMVVNIASESEDITDKEARDAADRKYEHGWETVIESEKTPKGINEDIVRMISAKKDEPEWMLDFRLKALKRWEATEDPDWAKLNMDPIDYQDIYYYAAPKSMKSRPKSLDEVDPELGPYL